MKTSAERLREIRAITGLSQKKFADKYEIPVRTLENWEAGSRVPPAYVITLLGKVVHMEYKPAGNDDF